jgi:hypothetical protein
MGSRNKRRKATRLSKQETTLAKTIGSILKGLRRKERNLSLAVQGWRQEKRRHQKIWEDLQSATMHNSCNACLLIK